MKRSLFLFLMLTGVSVCIYAQKKYKNSFIAMHGDENCRYIHKRSIKQRLSFYPFSIADTIELVSFRFNKNNIAVRKDSIIKDSLIEKLVLTKTQVNKLTDILYNNYYKLTPNYGSRSQCHFTPRHAILFIDSLGKIREHISLCFHCLDYRFSSEKVQFGDDCIQKMDKLYRFFLSAGIRYGTDPDVDEFPGEITYIDHGMPASPPK